MTDGQTKQGKFRVVHHPQVPGKEFKVIVDSMEEDEEEQQEDQEVRR